MNKDGISSEKRIAASHAVTEKKYWLKQFAGELVKSNIPYELPDKEGQVYLLEEMEFSIAGEVLARFQQLCGGSQTKEYMILTTLVNILLAKYTNHQDILLATPIPQDDSMEGEAINSLFVLRNQVTRDLSFKELLLQVRQTIIQAAENQNYPFELLRYHLTENAGLEEPAILTENMILLEGLHDWQAVDSYQPNLVFAFDCREEEIVGRLRFHRGLYSLQRMEQVAEHLTNLFVSAMDNLDAPCRELQMLGTDELERILGDFNGERLTHSLTGSLGQLFAEQAKRTPDRLAVVYGDDTLTYRELDQASNQIANYLLHGKGVQPDQCVGILLQRSVQMIVAILGVLKAGAAYLPIGADLPEQRVKHILDQAQVQVLISEQIFVRRLNRLQAEVTTLESYLCLDADNIYEVVETEKNNLMDQQLWDFIAESGEDEITQGGWYSSYTGQPFSRDEMDEYSQNICQKLAPYLQPETRVLEIGCASGISMFKLAPKVGFYYGTDLSEKVIEKNRVRAFEEGMENIKLAALAAHEMDELDERGFDLIIINSVIQSFHGHNYLRRVIRSCVDLLKDEGYLFIGDVMDQDLKAELMDDVENFRKANQGKNYNPKLDWSKELFVGKNFFTDLTVEIPALRNVQFSRKYHTIENELTRYRYDALFRVEKSGVEEVVGVGAKKSMYQDDRRVLAEYATSMPNSEVTGENLAYVLFTSGTTGKPKGVMVEHRNVINLVLGLEKRIYQRYPTGLRVSLLAHYGFDASVQQIFAALLLGHTLQVVPEEIARDGERLVDYWIDQQIDILDGTPTHLQMMLQSERPWRPSALKHLIIGGEALSPEIARQFLQRFGQEPPVLTNIYGPTECCVDCTSFDVSQENVTTLESMPIGTPLPNQKVYVLGPDHQVLPIGVPGEIWIGGAGVSRGYLGNQEMSRERFISSPFVLGERIYRTGDLGFWRADGLLEFLGRQDGQTKIRGFRIELGEIESQLLAHEDVQNAVVRLREDVMGNKALCAYLILSRERQLSELQEYLATFLPDYMIPAHFVKLDHFPVTSSGKLDVKALDAQSLQRVTNAQRKLPTNKLEEAVYQIWQESLGFEEISIEDNFFELGGDSLKGMMVVNRYRELLGEIVYISLIFEANTIVEHAQYLQEHYTEAVNRVVYNQEVAQQVEYQAIDRQLIREIHQKIPQPEPFSMVGKKNKRAVFILSSPRTGSTLLRVLLAGHSKLFAPQELSLLSFNTLQEKVQYSSNLGAVRAMMEIKNCTNDQAFAIWQELEEQGMTIPEFYGWMQEGIGDQILVDKTPAYGAQIETLRRAEQLFEDPLYIHLVRHPYGMIHSFEEARLDLLFSRAIQDEYRLARESLAELNWIITQQNISEFFKTVPAERRHLVRFEDMVTNPWQTVEELCQFLELEFEEGMLHPYDDQKKRMTDAVQEGGQVIGDGKFNTYSRIKPEIADRWKQFYMKDFLSEETWKIAQEFGYERIQGIDQGNGCDEEKELLELAEEFSEEELLAGLAEIENEGA